MARGRGGDQELVIEDDDVVEEAPTEHADALPVALLILTTLMLLVAIFINLHHLGAKFGAGLLG
ncbi:MAG: hypothetical protein HYR85_26175 [Planctomycetes bacterium]|nr:hypothetical protein [Planctomycetota bacterium]MBI3846943.1 hypothetical protein [Planctomycetota bacterium]